MVHLKAVGSSHSSETLHSHNIHTFDHKYTQHKTSNDQGKH